MVAESILVLSFLAGIISFVSPCIVPMIMVYLSLITGLTTDELVKNHNEKSIRRNIVINTILFVLGFSIIFILAGSAAGFAGSLFKDFSDTLTRVGGVFIILMGLHVARVIDLSFIHKIHVKGNIDKMNGVGYMGSFLVGIFFAIFCSHCIGPTLYSMLIFAGSTTSAYSGATIMAMFSLGLAIPYLVAAIGITSVLDRLERVKHHMRTFAIVNGIILVIIGIIMITGNFGMITQLVTDILPFKLPVGMGV